MKLDFWTVVTILLLLCGGYYFVNKNIEAKREARRAMQVKAQQVQFESEKKKSSLKMLQDYVAREEANLRKTIEEHETWLNGIREDQKILSDAVTVVETQARKADESSAKNKQKRYSSAERVLLILKDKDINDLAVKYLEEDFSAMRAQYQDSVNKEIKSHIDYQKKLKAITDKYNNTVAGLNKHVDKLNAEANQAAREAYNSVRNSLQELTDEKKKRERDLKSMRVGVATRKEIAVLTAEINHLDEQIEAARQRYQLAVYTDKESKARSAESSIRQKQVTAMGVRNDESEKLTAERIHETAVFNLSTLYEGRSLDMIRNKMKNRIDILQKEINDAKSKLDVMRATAENVDFLNAKDLDKIRESIAKQVVAGVSTNMAKRITK